MVQKQPTVVLFFGLLLFLGTLALYFPVRHNGFLNYDDPAYITSNVHVRQGLTPRNVEWAFTSTSEANWHPLTWISHMADVQVFGMNPQGHHAQSVVWHAVNVLLLFLLLAKATGLVGRSAVVSGLFAAHPLNVESVAWAAERKTLLSAFFLLLACAAYGWYVRRPVAGRYTLVALLFALGLMAKPMGITLPFLLLLLDWWPLMRFPETSWGKLALEKVPLLGLAAASAGLTLYAQRAGGAVGAASLLPFAMRFENAVYSYFLYAEKAIWPSSLAVFYPHPEGSLAGWRVIGAAAALAAITLGVWRFRDRRYLLAGWFWFLGSLVPMIGIVQVGRQGWADRYAYVPLWGLFVIAVWMASEFASRIGLGRTVRVLIAFAVLVMYAMATHIEIEYWRDSYRLFARAIEVTGPNAVAEGNLGSALMEMQRPDLALPHLERAIQLVPVLSAPHYTLGILLFRANQLAQAEREYHLALLYGSDAGEAAQAHNNLGVLLHQQGRTEEAVSEFSQAIALNHDEQNSFIGRGMIEREQGKLDAALEDFTRAEQIAPSASARYWKGRVLQDQGHSAAAAEAYRAALRLAPNFADTPARLAEAETRK
jgi:tetratricopeptide (TPR) repeat protein